MAVKKVKPTSPGRRFQNFAGFEDITKTTPEKNLIKNATFGDWTDDAPDSWTVSVGARNGGDAPASTVRQGEGPSLELSGNARTLAWNTVSRCRPQALWTPTTTSEFLSWLLLLFPVVA